MSIKGVLKTGVAAAALVLGLAGWQTKVNAQTSGDQADQGAIETVVVTAEKRSENVQSVPVTVNVISGAKLEDLGATDLADYAGYIPGLNIIQGVAPGNDTLVIRGLSMPSPTALVGTYLDDTPFGSSGSWSSGSTSALDLLPYDLQRVEVLEGPQGTLYGANSMGGLVKYVTTKPDLDNFSARAGASISTIDGASGVGWDIRGMVNIPLVADQLGLRVSYTDDVTPGYIDYPNQGIKGGNTVREQAGHVALRYEPTSDLTIDVSALLQFVNEANSPYVTLTPTSTPPLVPDTGPLSNSQTAAQPFTDRVEYYSATVNYNLGWSTLTSATSWSTLHSKQTAEIYYPYNAVGVSSYATSFVTLPSTKFTEELRLASSGGGPFEWLVGAFYDDERGMQVQGGNFTTADGTPLPNPAPNAINPLVNIYIPSFYGEMAAFANGTYHITDALDVSAGGRWSQNNQHFSADITCSLATAALGACPPSEVGTSVGDIVNWEVSPEYHFTSDVMAYVRVATGYRPGGPNNLLPPPYNADSTASFGPDELTNYETGIKSQWLDHTLQVDASVYDIEWTRIQLTGVAGPYSYTVNGNDAQVKGFEIASQYSPIANLHLGYNLTYTDAYLSQDMPTAQGESIIGVKGNALPFVPRFTSSATVDYDYSFANGWMADFGGGWRYMSDRFLTVNNPGNCAVGSCLSFSQFVPRLPSTSIFDAHISVTSDLWTVSLIGRNIADEHAWTNLSGGNGPPFDPGPVVATPLQPRLIMLSVERRF